MSTDRYPQHNLNIGLQKAILWEEAKGKLRALVAAEGQTYSSTAPRSHPYGEISEVIESFITNFESEGMQE